MKGKRIGTSVLAAVMLAGTTATSALAAMPDRSAVIGEKAFELSYVNAEENQKEIREAIIAAKAAGQKIYVKSRNVWYNNDETKLTDTSVIPAVVYKTAEGEVSYEAGDGEEVTEGFEIVDISASGVKKFKVVFSEAADTEKALFTVKKGNYVRNIKKVEWNEEKTEATINVHQTNVKGEYTVTVNGLELAENAKTFNVEEEKVAKIVIDGDKIPVKGGKVKVYYSKLNQYGEKTTKGGSPVISSNLSNMDASTAGEVTFDQPIDFSLPQNININEMDFVLYIYCGGVNVNKTLKAVPGAKASTIALTDVYTKLDVASKMKPANLTQNHAELQTVYVKVELQDQYGNVMDKNFFGGNALTKAQIVNNSAHGSLLISGLNADDFTEEYVYNNTANAKDNSIYLKITEKKKDAFKAGELMMFAALNGDVQKKSLTINDIVKSNNIDISLPEIYYGEKNVITDFAVYDVNGAPIEGAALKAKLQSGLEVGVGNIVAEINDKTGKVELAWDLTSVKNAKDGVVFLSIKPDSMKYENRVVTLKAAAYAQNVILKNNTMMKMRPTTSLTIKLSDMLVSDQYGRTMKASANAGLENIKLAGATNTTGTVIDADGATIVKNSDGIYEDAADVKWTINAKAAGSEGTADAEIQLTIGDKTETYAFQVETVAADAVKSMDVKVSETLYANSADAKYAGKYSIVGKTANGEDVKLAADDYVITAAGLTTNAGVITHADFNVAQGKTKAVKFFVLSKIGAGNVDKTITFKGDAPVINEIKMTAGKDLVYAGTKTAYTNTEIKAMVKLIDQYGVKLDTGIQNILFTKVADKDNSIQIANNGQATAAVSNLTKGDEVKVQIWTNNNKQITFTIKKEK